MKKFDLYWEIETKSPILVSITVTGIIAYFKVSVYDIENFKEILGAVINIGSILIGFMGVMLSILISVTKSNIIKKICENNAGVLLVNYFLWSFCTGFVSVIFSTIFYAFLNRYSTIYWILFLIWILSFTLFIITTIRVLINFSGILKSILGDQKICKNNIQEEKTSIKNVKGMFDKKT